MNEKQLLIEELEDLLRLTRESESEEDIYNILRRRRFFTSYPSEYLEHRIHRIERNIERLANRPITACSLATEKGEEFMQLMIGQGPLERNKGITYLSDWLSSPTKLTIADPYLIKNSGAITEHDYKNSLEELLPNSLSKLELFVGPRCVKYQKPGIATWFNDLCQTREITLSVFHQEQVHDRVWIKNGNDAIVVGTSFNGLGNKCAFLLKLDATDTADFNSELEKIRNNVASSSEV